MLNSRFTFFLILLCVALSALLFQSYFSKAKSFCPQKYSFLSPDLNCTEDPQSETLVLKETVENLINEEIDEKRAQKISVFYRDLNNRQWFGVGENENFAPGSLLKLPLAVAYYKLAEIDPNSLEKSYRYSPPNNQGDTYYMQSIKPPKELEPGAVYSVSEFIRRMIQYSDNEPVVLLGGMIDQAFLGKVFVDLGIYFPNSAELEQDFVSVKTYGAILRSLYNASYLNQFFSNQLLEMMSGSTFRSGIVTGVPEGVKVANKFGERVVTDIASNKINLFELHDCGIIYEPKRPYILCIMTKGTDYEKLSGVIAKISQSIYENR